MVGDYVGGWEGASVSRWGFLDRPFDEPLRRDQDRLRASMERDSRFHGNDGLGRRGDGEEERGPFDFPQGERNSVPPVDPWISFGESGE